MSARHSAEDCLRRLEREKALLQHQNTESLRKAELEAERKRSLENEGQSTSARKRCSFPVEHLTRISTRLSIKHRTLLRVRMLQLFAALLTICVLQ